MRCTRLNAIVTLAIAGLIVGCSNPVEQVDDPIIEEPVVSGPNRYSILMIFTSISVAGDCDADVAFGIDNPGEISYSVGYAKSLPDGTRGRDLVVKETRDFGSSDGDSIKLKAGDEYLLGDTQAEFELEEGEWYWFYFASIEWDGNSKDRRMDSAKRYLEAQAGGDQPGEDLDVWDDVLIVGSGSDCRLELNVGSVETNLN